MENPQKEIKKILSIKSWRTEMSHYWSVNTVPLEASQDLIGSLPECIKEIANAKAAAKKYLAC